jgi:hypothetical protein
MKDGGQALPMYYGEEGLHEGMTLWDWFAGQSLHAIIPRPTTIEDFESVYEYTTAFAETAYEIADAMIKAREEKNVTERA